MNKVHISGHLLDVLYEAQKHHLIHTLQYNRNGDDGGDYISSALDCFTALQEMSQDQEDLRALDVMLNSKPNYDREVIEYPAYDNTPDDQDRVMLTVVNLAVLASDGICSAIYDLNPPVLGRDNA